MTGGRERTEEEYRRLLEAAGLRLTRVVPTLSPMSDVEAARSESRPPFRSCSGVPDCLGGRR